MLEIPQHLLYSLQRVLLCTIMRKMYTVAHTHNTHQCIIIVIRNCPSQPLSSAYAHTTRSHARWHKYINSPFEL